MNSMDRKKKFRRVSVILMMLLFLIVYCPLSIQANAADNKYEKEKELEYVNGQLLKMYEKANEWYHLALAIAIPCLIVKFASYGIQIVGALFLSRGEFQMDKIKRDILFTLMAVAVLCLLPSIMTWAKSLVESKAWSKGVTILPHGGGWL